MGSREQAEGHIPKGRHFGTSCLERRGSMSVRKSSQVVDRVTSRNFEEKKAKLRGCDGPWDGQLRMPVAFLLVTSFE